MLSSEHPNIQVVEGVWDSAPQMRQAALQRLRRLAVDVCLITDADEIYPDASRGLRRTSACLER